MSEQTKNEALDNIQDIALFLAVEYQLPNKVREYVRIIEALARHRDLSNFLDAQDQERLDRAKRANR